MVSPANRFERLACEADLEQLPDEAQQAEMAAAKAATEFFEDRTKSFIRTNDSPDLPFQYSINPYRGCEHGCAYCYARHGHETLGLNAGLDFETKIFFKPNAARLLRAELNRSSWVSRPITISGVTDCYQPAERVFKITRSCLEVLVEAQQTYGIVTKNALVMRDLDLLQESAGLRLVHVNLSLTTLDAELARRMEPRTSTPAARLATISRLAQANVPVAVMVSPIIPGLNDHEIPAILRAARDAGALAAYSTLLRLPLTVEPVFREWLAANYPQSRDRVESRIRECRTGQLSQSEYHTRMRGSGPYAQNIRQTFQAFANQLGLADGLPPLDTGAFRPPATNEGQQTLF